MAARKVCRELLTVAEQAHDRAERPARGDAPARLFAARADRSAKPASKPSKSGGGAPPRRAKGADGAWTAVGSSGSRGETSWGKRPAESGWGNAKWKRSRW